MNRTTADRDAWHPQTREDREAILRELAEVLASPHFCNSKRYPALLQFIVENTLDGKADLLKERTLGVEVFDRPPTFDTNSDTVVRYTAGEVRKRLLLYYHEHGRNSNIRISLPAGSYIPEFLHGPAQGEEAGESAGHATEYSHDGLRPGDAEGEAHRQSVASSSVHLSRTSIAPLMDEGTSSPMPRRTRRVAGRMLWFGPIAIAVLAGIALFNWKTRTANSQTAIDDFWAPVLRDQHVVVVCTGGVVFANNNFSGVVTAGRDVDYPFVSMQNASAIDDISGKLQSSGATTPLAFASSETLTELREHSVALLGAYNNEWTLRLLQPLRFHFTPEPIESIVDEMHPQMRWERDHSLPYSSADDYALLARFRDATIDGWVVVVAGLGRNGTEAAAQFAVSPHYMQLLRSQFGKDFSNRNIEVVLKVKVIDGKTGAPSIQAVHTW